jgi:hypothetical protein
MPGYGSILLSLTLFAPISILIFNMTILQTFVTYLYFCIASLIISLSTGNGIEIALFTAITTFFWFLFYLIFLRKEVPLSKSLYDDSFTKKNLFDMLFKNK